MSSASLCCPFCGCSIDFSRLPVVATNISEATRNNLRQAESVRNNFRHGESASQVRSRSRTGSVELDFPGLPSGTPVLDLIDGWPVIRRSLTDPNRTSEDLALVDTFRRLLRISDTTQLGPPEDLPAYLCINCRHPLPAEIETHEVFTVGVVGTIGSGKSHFLAAMIRDASRLQVMASLGIADFAPDERTGIIYQSDYYRPVFRDHQALARTTREQADIRFRPMSFKVALERTSNPTLWSGDSDRRILLLFHDVSGEVLTHREERAAVAPFLQRADAIIFLVDPVALDPVRQWRMKTRGSDYGDFTDDYHQTDLLRACISEIGEERLYNVPVAITLSKSDIITDMLKGPFIFSRPPATEPAAWLAERNAIHSEVIEVLRELEASDILAAATHVPRATFHAIAPIGMDPNEDGRLDKVRSLRCADPVANVLLYLLNI
jgi:hypothetical protein